MNEKRLSQIKTNWSEVFSAQSVESDGQTNPAQRDLLMRYAGAIYRYLLAAVHDPNVADDLAQDFAYRFVRGDFRNADPNRGRFRDFVKRALINLVTDHYRKRKSSPRPLGDLQLQTPDPQSENQFDEIFEQSWRKEVLSRTWESLDLADKDSRTCYAAVLRLRAKEPNLGSKELAVRLSSDLDRSVNSDWVRQTMRRARARFGQLLRQEVRKTLGDVSVDQVDQELGRLGLLKHAQA